MMSLLYICVLVVSASASATVPAPTSALTPSTPALVPETFAFDQLGQIHALGPTHDANTVIIWVHDGNAVLPAGVERVAQDDTLVLALTANALSSGVLKGKGPCSYPAGDLEALSHYIQMKHGFAQYHKPVLLGSGVGAAWVYATLAQTPPNTFAGAITLGLCPELDHRRGVCRGRGLHAHQDKPPRWLFEPVQTLEEEWINLAMPQEAPCAHTADANYVSRTPKGAWVAVQNTAEPWNDIRQAAQTLTQHTAAPLQRAPDDLAELPIIEVPATGDAQPTMALMISGDGGWASIDREVSAYLAGQGIPVIGLSALQYFWHKRDADSTAHDVSRILTHYLTTWQKPRVILIGFSFGADVLPFVARRLPAELQSKVALVALLAPSPRVSFEFHLTDWVGGGDDNDALPVLPEINQISQKVLCLQSSSDSESPCGAAAHVTAVKLKGGHHFDGDYAGIAQQILQAREPCSESQLR